MSVFLHVNVYPTFIEKESKVYEIIILSVSRIAFLPNNF